MRENGFVLCGFQSVEFARHKHIVREIFPITAERHIKVRRGFDYAVFKLIAISAEHIIRGIFELPDRTAGRVTHVHVSEWHTLSSEIICALTSGASRKCFKRSRTSSYCRVI